MGEPDVRSGEPAKAWPGRLFAAIDSAPAEAVAIRTTQHRVTYGQLQSRLRHVSSQVPRAVRGELVGLLASRSAEYVLCLLGLWLGGAIPVVTEESWTDSQRLDAWARAGCGFVADMAGRELRVRKTGDPARSGNAECLSHVLFTSGSLGRPAANYIGARTFDLGIAAYEAVAEMRADDVVPMLSAPSHDPGLRDVLAPLLGGAQLCIPPGGIVASPGPLAEWVARSEASVLHVVPVRLRLLCHAQRVPVRSVRLVVSSGGVLTPQDAALLRHSFPEASLVNGYGLTETPQLVACRRWAPGELDAAAAASDLSIGRPLGRCRVEVWPRDGEGPVPDGRHGEICVAEPHIAEPHIVEPQIVEPHLSETGIAERQTRRGPGGPRVVRDRHGVRWCRTGDLGWKDGSGELHFSGRIGRLQKVNGRLLDLDLVETVATSSPDVIVAVTRVVRRSDRDLVEIALWAAGAFPDACAAVGAHLDAAPGLGGFPWTLVEGGSARLSPALKPVYAEERTGSPAEHLERILRLAEALVGAPVDEQASFMDSGFTSEGLLVFAEALGEELGVEVPLLDLFRAPTPRALAAALAAGPATEAGPGSESPPLPDTPRRERADRESTRRQVIRQIRSEESWIPQRTRAGPEGRRT